MSVRSRSKDTPPGDPRRDGRDAGRGDMPSMPLIPLVPGHPPTLRDSRPIDFKEGLKKWERGVVFSANDLFNVDEIVNSYNARALPKRPIETKTELLNLIKEAKFPEGGPQGSSNEFAVLDTPPPSPVGDIRVGVRRSKKPLRPGEDYEQKTRNAWLEAWMVLNYASIGLHPRVFACFFDVSGGGHVYYLMEAATSLQKRFKTLADTYEEGDARLDKLSDSLKRQMDRAAKQRLLMVDIKRANIVVYDDYTVKFIDFGADLARPDPGSESCILFINTVLLIGDALCRTDLDPSTRLDAVVKKVLKPLTSGLLEALAKFETAAEKFTLCGVLVRARGGGARAPTGGLLVDYENDPRNTAEIIIFMAKQYCERLTNTSRYNNQSNEIVPLHVKKAMSRFENTADLVEKVLKTPKALLGIDEKHVGYKEIVAALVEKDPVAALQYMSRHEDFFTKTVGNMVKENPELVAHINGSTMKPDQFMHIMLVAIASNPDVLKLANLSTLDPDQKQKLILMQMAIRARRNSPKVSQAVPDEAENSENENGTEV